jgi:hypothetical protein
LGKDDHIALADLNARFEHCRASLRHKTNTSCQMRDAASVAPSDRIEPARRTLVFPRQRCSEDRVGRARTSRPKQTDAD